ncbi:hypothetical protein JCM33374_g6239 [Metschnikowia sp. JCM 33374]|nr:hypothetical protein JCM33374_g6239 [Metschnikowia sp. JCM 33374]
MQNQCLQTDFTSQTNLSPLEREVLLQYQSLAIKLYKLADEIKKIHLKSSVSTQDGSIDGQAHALLQNMRGLERKIGLVYTLFRTAVYSLLIQNEEDAEHTGGDLGDHFRDLENTGSGLRVRQLESDDEGTSMMSND